MKCARSGEDVVNPAGNESGNKAETSVITFLSLHTHISFLYCSRCRQLLNPANCRVDFSGNSIISWLNKN